ncbi:aminotransferase class I/II-fold pyridoxal phosphate-dependent enzyme [Candidatus Carsonella ruddii]|uniref:histidinol-phosphate transaminase n=1 Tax=Candidatus Carsonella ruddii (Diaphorina cf. continua) TaxID=2661587 RepID=A0A7R6VZJ5_CARRU|nr:aminotransferase class I/II-fold pyridoxal phosphate-dependent enzyme [Candidatus Carsonella ruddii (Diaphorina cf. continua)]BCG49288.1 histidinol-phosphate transaminase [Candidatus Carsonella ruddii (Diaphorina cf. continua)]
MIYSPGKRYYFGHKLNANENWFSTSKNIIFLIKTISKNFEKLKFYPDSDNFYFTQIISKTYNLKKKEIFICNGSDEGLFFLFFLFKNFKIKIPKISYPFYNVYSSFNKIYTKKIKYKKIINFNNIIFPSPNSPYGVFFKKKEIINKINKRNFIIIDEAYCEFYNMGYTKYISNNNNLIIIKTLSKSFSLAGSRIGIIFSNEKIIKKLNFIKHCFNSYTIDTINNLIGIESIKDKNYLYYKMQKNNFFKLLLNFFFKKKNEGNFICIPKNIDFNFYFSKKYFFFRNYNFLLRITISNYFILKKIIKNYFLWS